MKLYTYTGQTPDEAMRAAKSIHGSDPLIISSKEIQKKGLGQKGLYEIVIAVEEETQPKAPPSHILKKLEEQKKHAILKQDESPLIDENLSETIRQISKISQNATQNPSPHYPSPKPSIKEQEEIKSIKKEIEQIGDRLKLIQSMFWEEKKPTLQSIPQEFAEIYNLAKQSGIDSERLDALMSLTLEHMPVQMRSSSITIKRYFREVLRKMISCRNENLNNAQRNVLMFVGPTGVGKTTTLAKIAARYSLMMGKKYKVGVISLDSYKIAAMEQLMTYARMMKLGIERVDDPNELQSAIEKLGYCDFILIDTAGHSQYDNQKLSMLKRYLQSDFRIDVSLVLSATTKYEDLKDIYQSFSEVEIDNIIFSKLDESRSFGNIFSLACDIEKPISYFSIGQSVPNDLLVASNEFLVDCLLEGFNLAKKEQK